MAALPRKHQGKDDLSKGLSVTLLPVIRALRGKAKFHVPIALIQSGCEYEKQEIINL